MIKFVDYFIHKFSLFLPLKDIRFSTKKLYLFAEIIFLQIRLAIILRKRILETISEKCILTSSNNLIDYCTKAGHRYTGKLIKSIIFLE